MGILKATANQPFLLLADGSMFVLVKEVGTAKNEIGFLPKERVKLCKLLTLFFFSPPLFIQITDAFLFSMHSILPSRQPSLTGS